MNGAREVVVEGGAMGAGVAAADAYDLVAGVVAVVVVEEVEGGPKRSSR